jgi:hypothetical protein
MYYNIRYGLYGMIVKGSDVVEAIHNFVKDRGNYAEGKGVLSELVQQGKILYRRENDVRKYDWDAQKEISVPTYRIAEISGYTDSSSWINMPPKVEEIGSNNQSYHEGHIVSKESFNVIHEQTLRGRIDLALERGDKELFTILSKELCELMQPKEGAI